MRALLDVNILLALLDSDHIDHERAMSWLEENIDQGWSSCAITQNGFIRIISQPRYPNPVTPAVAVSRLQQATNTPHHEFWACEVSMLDPDWIEHARILRHAQITDAYLLALAASHGGRFVTFDKGLDPAIVPGGADHLQTL